MKMATNQFSKQEKIAIDRDLSFSLSIWGKKNTFFIISLFRVAEMSYTGFGWHGPQYISISFDLNYEYETMRH